MKSNFVTYFVLVLIIVTVFSCEFLPWKKELKAIGVVKGLTLGNDYDVERAKTFICDQKFQPLCGYELINKRSYGIVASYPRLFYGTYNGKKILAQIRLELLDPYNYPVIGGEITPAVSSSDVELVKQKFKDYYGYQPNSETENSITWVYQNDVLIKMNIKKNDFSHLENLSGVNPHIKQYRNSYSIIIDYSFIPELNNLILYEPIGSDRSL